MPKIMYMSLFIFDFFKVLANYRIKFPLNIPIKPKNVPLLGWGITSVELLNASLCLAK